MEYGVSPLVGRLTNIFLVLMLIGALIGIWMVSGTIPYLMYLGVKTLSPGYFLVSTSIIVSVGAIVTGTSFGTGATFGVALMGVAQVLGISLPQTAGAIVMGAFLGDKLSPLSDTTITAAGMAETDIFDHIKSTMYTTLPGYAIGLVIFLVVGFQYSGSAQTENITALLQSLQQTFILSPILLIPPAILLTLSYRRYSTVPVLWISILAAIPLALYQGHGIAEITGAMAVGPDISTNVDAINSLLANGGVQSMTNILTILLFAFLFAGELEYTKTIGIISESIRERFVHDNSGRLVFATSITGAVGVLSTGTFYIPLIVPPIMFSDLYDELGIKRNVLSRTLEDSGTALAPIIPWSVAGLYFSSILGVSTLAYAPWAFICYLSPIIAWIYGFSDVFVFRREGSDDAV